MTRGRCARLVGSVLLLRSVIRRVETLGLAGFMKMVSYDRRTLIATTNITASTEVGRISSSNFDCRAGCFGSFCKRMRMQCVMRARCVSFEEWFFGMHTKDILLSFERFCNW